MSIFKRLASLHLSNNPSAQMQLVRQWKPRCQQVSSRREGALLLIVLVTVVVLSLSAYTFTTLMQTEEEAARLTTLRLQTKYLTDSGLDYTRMFLANSDATIQENGGTLEQPRPFKWNSCRSRSRRWREDRLLFCRDL